MPLAVGPHRTAGGCVSRILRLPVVASLSVVTQTPGAWAGRPGDSRVRRGATRRRDSGAGRGGRPRLRDPAPGGLGSGAASPTGASSLREKRLLSTLLGQRPEMPALLAHPSLESELLILLTGFLTVPSSESSQLWS